MMVMCYEYDLVVENKKAILKLLVESKKGPTLYKKMRR